MDLLTRAELESLAGEGHGDVQVSMFMPTHRFGSGIEVDKLCWKNLVSGVEAVLGQQMRRPDVETVLAPAQSMQDDAIAWQYMSDGLAMFLRNDSHRTFRVPAAMPTFATVGDRLVMGPMLRLFSGDEHFLLLALSQREIRLLEGSRTTVEEIQLRNVPTSLDDVVAPGASFGRDGATRCQRRPWGHNPDNLSADELHRMAWPVIERKVGEQQAEVIDRFNELRGTGLASSDLQAVAQAAAVGRIETLFVTASPSCWEVASDGAPSPVVHLGSDERYADSEQLDAAAISTLNSSGQVYASSQPVAPDSEVAAIFRY